MTAIYNDRPGPTGNDSPPVARGGNNNNKHGSRHMLQKLKRKLRIYRIKKDALRPRPPGVTVEDIQRKLQDYTPPVHKIVKGR